MNSFSLTNYLIFSRIFYQFISGSCLSLGLGGGEGDQPVTLHLRYLFRLISSHPYSSSGLCTRPTIYYSTVCSAPFFRRLGYVVFLPFLRNQFLTNALSRKMQDHILRPPTQPHGCVVSMFLSLYSTYEGWNFNSGNYLFTTDTK